MRRNLEDQIHNQSILIRCMDLMFDVVVTDFRNCSQLLNLSLSSNVLMGGIPQEFDKLRYLERLYLAQNRLVSADSTPIFGALSNCTSLQKLSLRNNALKSNLPGSVGQLSQTLFYLSLTENHCTVSIPQEMSNLTGLITLYLGRNFLSGSLLSALGGMPSLQLLQLSENKLEALLLDTTSEVLPLVVSVVGRVGSETLINCQNNSLKCVILEEMAKQHFLKHNDAGWIPDSALMLPIRKEVPWYLEDGTNRVYVVGSRGAKGLELTVASEVFEESGRSPIRGTLDYLQGLKMLGVK